MLVFNLECACHTGPLRMVLPCHNGKEEEEEEENN